MDIFFLVLHVVLSLGIITLVLLQKGAGASAGASFGGGAGSVFGASGSSNFLSKTTAVFAIGFFLNSLLLAYMASHRDIKTDSVLDALTAPAAEFTVPAEDLSGIPAADITEDLSDVPAADVIDVPASAEFETSAEDDVPPPAGE